MSEPTITLYVDQTVTRSYEVQTTESAIRAALATQGVAVPAGDVLADVIDRGLVGYSGELALTKLVGDTSDVDTGESWDVTDWDDDSDDDE